MNKALLVTMLVSLTVGCASTAQKGALGLAYKNYQEGDFEEAVLWSSRAMGPNELPHARKAEVLFLKALSLEKLGRQYEAEAVFRFLSDGFPETEYGYRAKEKLASAQASSIDRKGASPDRELFDGLHVMAERGDAEAQYHIGMMYNNGIGVSRDMHKALEWMQKSSHIGHPLAHFKLGCYYGGQGGAVPVNDEKALYHYLIAAEAGYSLAQGSAGLYRLKKNDFDEAFRWLKAAADQGYPNAFLLLSELYYSGKGVLRNPVLAYAYGRLAQSGVDETFKKEAKQQLDKVVKQLSPAQQERAEHFVRKHEVKLSPLTIKAGSGLEGMRKYLSRHVVE